MILKMYRKFHVRKSVLKTTSKNNCKLVKKYISIVGTHVNLIQGKYAPFYGVVQYVVILRKKIEII